MIKALSALIVVILVGIAKIGIPGNIALMNKLLLNKHQVVGLLSFLHLVRESGDGNGTEFNLIADILAPHPPLQCKASHKHIMYGANAVAMIIVNKVDNKLTPSLDR